MSITIGRKARKAIGAATAVAALVVGGWLIASHLAAQPPDPASADPQRVVAFFMSDHFTRLSLAEQQRYIEQMLRRYAAMDEQQRQQVDAAVRGRREADRRGFDDRMVEMWKNYVVAEAQRYFDLPPEQRDAFLRGRMRAWQMMGAAPPTGGAAARQDQELTAQRQERVVNFLQHQVMPRTSPRERALVTLFARDVIAHGAGP